MDFTCKILVFVLVICFGPASAIESNGLDAQNSKDIKQLRQDLLALKNEVTRLHHKNEELEFKLAQSSRMDKTKRLLLNTPGNNVNTSISKDSPKIAFYANTVSDGSNLGVHHPLIFDNVLTNVGSCYHHVTGTFLPNTSGVYVFYVNILMCAANHVFKAELVSEGMVKGTFYTADDTFCSNGGGMAVFHVNAGDSVWVRVKISDGVNGVAWESSFSGYLLYED